MALHAAVNAHEGIDDMILEILVCILSVMAKGALLNHINGFNMGSLYFRSRMRKNCSGNLVCYITVFRASQQI